MLSPSFVLAVIKTVMRVPTLQNLALHILKFDEQTFTLIDIHGMLQHLKVLTAMKQVSFFLKCQIKELSTPEQKGTALSLVEELQSVQDTVGVDFFYFRASVFNESVEPLLRLKHL